LFLLNNLKKFKKYLIIIIAVPKNRRSKLKTRIRKSNWKRKATLTAQKSLSLAKSVLQGKPTSFIYTVYDDDE